MILLFSVIILKIDIAHVGAIPGERDYVVSADVQGVGAFGIALNIAVDHAKPSSDFIDDRERDVSDITNRPRQWARGGKSALDSIDSVDILKVRNSNF